ncbi:MAG: MerR family transcriptional regulator [Anaerocolumna sp.]
MKDYYKISEISKLYGIGVDSLRYYEKIGVLKPKRDVNGYRLYSLKDIYKITIIKDLRQLNFSMHQIKEYLDHQNLGNTLDLLKEEQHFIKEQIKDLKNTEQLIEKRIKDLMIKAFTRDLEFTINTYHARPCLQLSTYITRDEEMDFAMKKLHNKHESKIKDFSNQTIGASASIEDLNKGIYNVFHSVFFVLEDETKEYDFILPKGTYLSYFYRGKYSQSSSRMLEVLQHAKEQNYEIIGNPFEIYKIDNRDTMENQEFLTEIQIQIVPR